LKIYFLLKVQKEEKTQKKNSIKIYKNNYKLILLNKSEVKELNSAFSPPVFVIFRDVRP
jgi:hypothetical protein